MDWSRKKAAKELGISRTALGNYERGDRSDYEEPVMVPVNIAYAALALEKLSKKHFREWGLEPDLGSEL